MFFRVLSVIFGRIKAIQRTRIGQNSGFTYSWNTHFHFEKNAEITIRNGKLRLGYPLAGTITYASYSRSVIKLGRNSRIIVNGNVAIAPGASINVKDNGTLVFEGDAVIAHNLTLICERSVTIGQGTHISWNATLIDSDGHQFICRDNQKARIPYSPLRIGDQVGLQMNVQIPRGVTIGRRAVIGAGTVVRRNIPEECVAYADSRLKINPAFKAAATAEPPTGRRP
jgi:acetyltransferase-like isoleucine patch superfamily enzyme